MRRLSALILTLATTFYCKAIPTVDPPEFDYANLARLATLTPGRSIPLTIQRGANLHPVASRDSILFFQSSRDGSSDIWLRDLKTTVAFPIVRHPAEQEKPAIPLAGDKLAYVSNDVGPSGNLRIVAIKPNEIIKASLTGVNPPNLWDDSANLSEEIAELATKMPAICQGKFAETDPVFSADGSYLYFISDRCARGTFNVWRVRLEGIKAKNDLQILTRNGAAQPALSLDQSKLVYVGYSFKANQQESRLMVLDLRTMQETEIKPHSQMGMLQYPALSPDGTIIYYQSIREDTNSNGQLDARDYSGVYSVSVLANSREARLLDASAALHGLSFSVFLGGSVLYSAESFQNINVYFLKPEGIIPLQSTIDEQLEYAAKFGANRGKKLLSLDALTRFFGNTREYLLVEGRSLQERLTASSQSEKPTVEREVDEARKRNEFVDFLWRLAEPTRKNKPEFIEKFLESLSQKSAPEKDLFRAGALEELSNAFEAEGKEDEALETLTTLNSEFPDYFRRQRTRFRQGVIALETSGEVPKVFLEELANKPSIERRDKILAEIVDYYELVEEGERMSMLESQLARNDLPDMIRGTLQFLKAHTLFTKGQDSEALAIVNSLQGAFPQDSGMYVRNLQLLAFILERKRDYEGAYDAKLRYGGAYRPGSGVKVGLEEYREILDQSDKSIQRSLRSARSIARVVEEADAIISRNLLTRTLEGTPAQLILNARQKPVFLNASDLEVLHDFCQQGSRAGSLIASLGKPEYLTSYASFCKRNAGYFAGENSDGMPLDDARDAADLLYVVAYANVNILNILFYNMKRVNLFESFHAEKSVEYHRLKIDIAMERNRTRIEGDRRKFALLDPKNVINLFQEGDPFDATAFNEVVHGYKFAATEARRAGELSFVYGYAYALTQKSVEREAFYSRIMEEGVTVAEDLRREKKQDTLRDLKTAEYLLQYILYVEPENADAYLLLGWLYQFIDDRRARTITRPESLPEQIVNFATRTPAARSTDGQYFIDIYRAYFPDRLYESNVELYRQAIQLISATKPKELALPDLNLNLANNYFQLLNFKKAIEHYNQYEDLRGANPVSPDRTREGLFYFNRGRAYYYEGQTGSASRDLRRAMDMYLTFELKPSEARVESLKFRLADGNERPESVGRLRVQVDEAQEALDSARLKVSVIAGLYGLSLAESGRYAEASRAYELADQTVEKMTEVDSPLRIGILNFLALARQNQSRIEGSDKNARTAAKMSQDLGLGRADDRYQPQSLGGRLLGCLLPYGEDFSVIGDGRNPFGLAPLRQYELSLGILLENRILAGDRSAALALLEERRSIFSGKDGDVKLGRMGLVTADNQMAFEEFNSGHFDRAETLFAEAAENARSRGFLDQARRNVMNRYHATFALFENNPEESPIARVAEGLARLDEFRSVYRDAARDEYIAQKQTEDPAFTYDEVADEAILQSQLNRRLQDFVTLEANLYFYRGDFLDRTARNDGDLESARADLQKALSLYDSILASQGGEPAGRGYFRARLNRVVVLSRLGKTAQVLSILGLLVDELEEFSLLHEEWFARFTYAKTALEHFRERGSPGDLVLARAQFLEAAQLLKANPTVRRGIASVSDFYATAADFFVSQGNPLQALEILEAGWAAQLEDQYLKYPIAFQSEAQLEAFEKFRNANMNVKMLLEREQSQRFSRIDSSATRAERLRALQTLESVRENLVSNIPLHEAFAGGYTTIPRLKSGQWVVRLFYSNGYLNAFAFTPHFQFIREPGKPAEAFAKLLQKLPRYAVTDFFVIADATMYETPIESTMTAIRPDIPAPVFVTRLADRLIGYSEVDPVLNQFNASDVGPLLPTDVLRLEGDFADDFFAVEKGRFDAREFLRAPRNVAMAVTLNTPASTRAFKDMIAFEGFRAGGVNAFMVPLASVDDTLPLPGESRLTGRGYRVFGSSGYRITSVQNAVKLQRATVLADARKKESLRDYSGSAEAYRLASSLSATLGDEPGYLDARIRSAGVRMLDNSAAGEEMFAVLLERKMPSESRATVYQEYFRAQFRLGKYAEAEATAKSWASELPGRETEVKRRVRLVTFLKHLEADKAGDHFQGTLFRDEFAALKSDLQDTETGESVVGLLLRRGFHEEAMSIAAAQPQPQRAILQRRVRASEALANGHTPDDSLDFFGGEYEFDIRTLGGYVARLKRGEILSAPEMREDLNPEQLHPLLNSLLLHLYLEASDADPGYVTARLVREVIDSEAKRSPERAANLAILAGQRYLAFGDIAVANRFYTLARELGEKAIPDPTRKRHEAELALALSFFRGSVSFSDAAEIAKTLPENSLTKIRAAFPASNSQEAIQTFLTTSFQIVKAEPAARPYFVLGLEALKARAIGEKNYSLALDVSALQSDAEHGRGAVRFVNVTEQLTKSLPGGQTFVGIVDAENTVHRIRIQNGKVNHDQWDQTVRELRSGIVRSVHARERGGDRDLARAFRGMVNTKLNQVAYLYLPSSLLLAPIFVEPGDRIFVVPALRDFVRRAPVAIKADFASNFEISLQGQRTSESTEASDRAWDERVFSMEDIAVRPRSLTRSNVLHVVDPKILAEKSDASWFSSVSRRTLRPNDTLQKYELDLVTITRASTAPGVFYCDTGSGEWAVKFMRYYYDSNSGIPFIDRRYLDAQIRLRRANEGPLNIRLIAPSILLDQ